MQTTTIHVDLQGKASALAAAIDLGCCYYTSRRMMGDRCRVTFIHETSDIDEAMAETEDCIDIEVLENWGVDVLSIDEA